MLITQLDVVNRCLATIGEVPLNSIDTDHPYAAAAVRLIPLANARVQAKGWWFNKETIKVHPDSSSKEIVLPSDFLGIDTDTQQRQFVARGRRLYDLAKQSYYFDEPVSVDIVRLIKFQDLAFIMQDLVQAQVVVEFVESYDADTSRIQQVRADLAMAERRANSEHTRNVNANIMEQGTVGYRRAGLRYPGLMRVR